MAQYPTRRNARIIPNWQLPHPPSDEKNQPGSEEGDAESAVLSGAAPTSETQIVQLLAQFSNLYVQGLTTAQP